MKLLYEFETMDMGGQLYAVPVGDNSERLHAVLEINDVAEKMLKRIGESATPEETHRKLCADFPEEYPKEVGERLCEFLNRLLKERLLVP